MKGCRALRMKTTEKWTPQVLDPATGDLSYPDPRRPWNCAGHLQWVSAFDGLLSSTWWPRSPGCRSSWILFVNQNWVAVKELKLSYQNSKAILFTIYPYCGNLSPLTATQAKLLQDLLPVSRQHAKRSPALRDTIPLTLPRHSQDNGNVIAPPSDSVRKLHKALKSCHLHYSKNKTPEAWSIQAG